MEERNSEGKATWIAVAGVVSAGVLAIGAELLGSGLLEKWPIAVTIVGVIVAVAKMVGDYTMSRPAKHQALASKAQVDLAKSLSEAKAAPTENPPQS